MSRTPPITDGHRLRLKSATGRIGKILSPPQDSSTSFVGTGTTKGNQESNFIRKDDPPLSSIRLVGRGGVGSRTQNHKPSSPLAIPVDNEPPIEKPRTIRYSGRGGAGSRPRVIQKTVSEYEIKGKDTPNYRSKWNDKVNQGEAGGISIPPLYLSPQRPVSEPSTGIPHRFGRFARTRTPSFDDAAPASPTSTICSDFACSSPETPSDPASTPAIHVQSPNSCKDKPWNPLADLPPPRFWKFNRSQTSLKSKGSMQSLAALSSPPLVVVEENTGCETERRSPKAQFIARTDSPLSSSPDRRFGTYLACANLRPSRQGGEKSWIGEWNEENIEQVIHNLRLLR